MVRHLPAAYATASRVSRMLPSRCTRALLKFSEQEAGIYSAETKAI